MEVVEDPLVHNSTIGEVQVNVCDGTPGIGGNTEECDKPNGVVETAITADTSLATVADPAVQDSTNVQSTADHEVISIEKAKSCESIPIETIVSSEADSEPVLTASDISNQQNMENQPDNGLASKIANEISEFTVESTETTLHNDLPQNEESLIEANTENSDMVTFKTEVLVERNENDVNETDQNDVNSDVIESSKHILSVMRQNLELSDVLHSDVADNMENNNSSTSQEVLNKEELLDILEGNDVDQADDQFIKIMQVDHTNIKTIEAQLALQQLTRLKSANKSRRSLERFPRRKKGEKRLTPNNSSITEVKTTRRDKRASETSTDESEVMLEDNKSKKDKKNSGSSSKTLDHISLDNRTSKKDRKVLEITTEIQGEHQKPPLETKADEVKSVPLETKTKRNRKIVDITSKVLESTVAESKNKKDVHKILTSTDNTHTSQDDETLETDSNKSNSVKENIVNVLVRDWEDDEHEGLKDEATERSVEETCVSKEDIKLAEELTAEKEVVVDQERIDGSSMDSSASFISEGQITLNKSGDESQPQRRLGRVIKKKVIFDPDNPDTFTKGKLVTKNKETISEKEQPTPKKSKIEVQQIPKAKSPTGKLHWKKPPPKPTKQNKRLTEVDKLLMDEGAVNMIYQLTPEAPKGKKNMRTKAEFIKKIQSSTPDSKEMKFRERKKESIKSEEAEAKKIIGGKQRGSLSSSVKSMSICEDFEAHSADDSIIYRRHSSSSYSSNCMSPLRVNDLDSGAAQGAARVSRHPSDSQHLPNTNEESIDQISDVFITDVNTTSPNEVINKSDCLSIKQKLNSKLSHFLNKRKRESMKTDRPAKQKRLSAKHDEKKPVNVKREEELSKIKSLIVTFDHNLAEICVKRKGEMYSIQILQDLELALAYVNSKEDITVTLLTSECGTLCSTLDLRSMLQEVIETRSLNAFSFAESIRSLLSTVDQHSKLLCTGVWGDCSGVGLALVALSDVVLASERARFGPGAGDASLLGTAALTSHSRLPKPLIDNIVVFGRQLSAEEALQGGLVSRVLWPDRFTDQLRDVAKDIARQPSRSLLLKKQLLSLSRGERTFQSCLEAERDLLAEYWACDEGQASLRARAALGSS